MIPAPKSSFSEVSTQKIVLEDEQGNRSELHPGKSILKEVRSQRFLLQDKSGKFHELRPQGKLKQESLPETASFQVVRAKAFLLVDDDGNVHELKPVSSHEMMMAAPTAAPAPPPKPEPEPEPRITPAPVIPPLGPQVTAGVSSKELRTRKLVLEDEKGNPRAELKASANGSVGLAFKNSKGKMSALFGIDPNQSPTLVMLKDGKVRASMDRGKLTLTGVNNAKVTVGIDDKSGEAGLVLKDAKGITRVSVTMDSNGRTTIATHDEQGYIDERLG